MGALGPAGPDGTSVSNNRPEDYNIIIIVVVFVVVVVNADHLCVQGNPGLPGFRGPPVSISLMTEQNHQLIGY